jgi:methylmalonyl-CoA mutase N-terminal domain/subunit
MHLTKQRLYLLTSRLELREIQIYLQEETKITKTVTWAGSYYERLTHENDHAWKLIEEVEELW